MKKKTFYKLIEETFKNNKEWKYYSEKEFEYNPMHFEENSKRFIKDFIELSEKQGNLLQGTDTLQRQVENIVSRATHIVSTFFIGHYIYQNTKFKELINKEIQQKVKKWGVESKVTFSFIWFLTCLFHDLGYAVEIYEKVKYSSLDKLEEDTRKLGEIEGIPEFYEKIYANYYRYRIKYSNVNDHGITAAFLMYHSLCKIRCLAESSNFNDENQQKLCWEEPLEKVYNFCAWNILAHNIWFCTDEKDVDKYKYYELNELILSEKDYKISIKDYPFFFLLCLVDTIEPYKRVENYEELKKIELEIHKKEQISVISHSDKYTLKDIEGLNNWLIPVERKATIKNLGSL